jgi:transcriptional regulator with XRE-family HTH domain
MTQPTGLDLKLERVAARVKAVDLAAAMGVHPSRISAIERDQFPTIDSVRRYREAIATCATSATSTAAQEVA